MNVKSFTVNDVMFSRTRYDVGDWYDHFCQQAISLSQAATLHVITQGITDGPEIGIREKGWMSTNDTFVMQPNVKYRRTAQTEAELWCVFRHNHPDLASSIQAVWLRPNQRYVLPVGNVFLAHGNGLVAEQTFTGPLHLEITTAGKEIFANTDVFLFVWP